MCGRALWLHRITPPICPYSPSVGLAGVGRVRHNGSVPHLVLGIRKRQWFREVLAEVPMAGKKISSWHVGVAAEAFAAGLFACCGLDVSVQYGADQPEYDLIIARGEKMLKVSVKGSQDGGWGLTQSYCENADYHRAADRWLEAHHGKSILCFVQFKGVSIDQLPRVYLARPREVASQLKAAVKGRGETILYEDHLWGPRAAGYGTSERLPDDWRFSLERVEELLQAV